MGFNRKSMAIIGVINELIAKFGTMTLRQVYYQLVPYGLKYTQVQHVLDKARKAGLIELDRIIDRSRPSYGLDTWTDLHELLTYYEEYVKLDYWAISPYRVEVWTEKDALSAILNEEAENYRVPVRVTRGYLSTSNRHAWSNTDLKILYFGDFDPSGLDMDENLKNSEILRCDSIKRVALTEDHVTRYDLPWVPVKDKDNRSPKYKARYGNRAWELDALDPGLLRSLVRQSIEPLLTFNLESKQREELALRQRIGELREAA